MSTNELKEWLEKEIEACNKLLETSIDSTKTAEYWFTKLAYENVIDRLVNEEISSNDLLIQLSQKAFVKLRNKFTGFFAVSELTVWYLEVEHVTHRGWVMNFEDKALTSILQQAICEIEQGEQRIKDRRAAFKILNPDLSTYDIAELERQERGKSE